jgi:Do/DeqQ family serine protease
MSRNGKIRTIAGATLVLLFVAFVTTNSYSQTLSEQGIQALENIQNSFRAVAQKVLPSVVEVNVVDVVKRPAQKLESPFEFFFGPRGDESGEREFRREGLGSGVIVRKTGNKVYVLTNNHVVGSADEISIKLHDGRQYDASLVGRDEKKDLALVVFETESEVPLAELGDSDRVQVGDWALAVGNPLGFESTVTVGIVSAVGRRSVPGSRIGGYTDYIQTDAAINQGNSGGALVNIRGKVVGISTWIASPSGGNVGLGFAIPINNAKKAIDDFITKGKVEYGWLGISVGNFPPQAAEDMGVGGRTGAFVMGVFKGSPADKARLLPGDFITAIEGEKIADSDQLLRIVGDLQPGESTRFDLIRDRKPREVRVRIEARAEEQEIAKLSSQLWPGMSVVGVTDRIRQQLDLPKSAGDVIIGVVRKGSPSDVAGFRTGDIIKKVNGKELKSVADFYRILNDTSSRELMFSLFRKGSEVLIGLVR